MCENFYPKCFHEFEVSCIVLQCMPCKLIFLNQCLLFLFYYMVMVTALLEAFFNSRRKPPLKNPRYALANLWKTNVETGSQVLTRMTRPDFNTGRLSMSQR